MFNIKKRKLRHTDFPKINYINEIKDRTLWKAKSHNEEKQINEFIAFTYFKYEAPIWAIEKIKKQINETLKLNEELEKAISDKEFELKTSKKISTRTEAQLKYIKEKINNQEKYFNDKFKFSLINKIENEDFFKSIQNGCGYFELLKKELTKKEIRHLVFNSKQETLQNAVYEAKLSSIIENKVFIQFIIERYSHTSFNLYKEAYIYLMKNKVEKSEWTELLDYITAKTRAKGHMFIDDQIIEKKDFFKRSINRIREESNIWHINQIKAKEAKYVAWDNTIKDMILEKTNTIWTIEELCSTKDLLKEGKSMSHCVGGYASKCINGESKIVSIKKNGNSHVTLEIRGNRIVQAKMKYNVSPDRTEELIINEFCNKNNFLNAA